MAKDVRCSVTTCAYHDSNNKCLANEIKVSNNSSIPIFFLAEISQ